eukprot:TRINITY_DN813_c1_g1_i4.p1 TRINITY_DN813_c1_g1~~TRINITY_DN813_c1_g1_i4.p1  ORF type:complete len:461 (+),score=142.94 TRINITY_DN813_c1_g1_i4:3397-4779(+)
MAATSVIANGERNDGANAAVVRRTPPLQLPRLLRIVLVDYNGISRCKAVPFQPQQRHASNALLVKGGVVLMPDGSLPSGSALNAVGEVYMLPPRARDDAQPAHTLPRIMAWPTHANHSMVVAHLHRADGKPWALCPRQCLCRAVQLLHSHELSMLAGFELEFVLLQRDGTPFGDAAGYALHAQLDAAASVLDHMVAALTQADIGVNMVHAEAAAGQFEIVLAHKPLLRAVDELISAREIVRAVAHTHALRASFMPKRADAGSGAHVHFSLAGHFGGSHTLFEQHVGMSAVAQHFVAGVLHALPWLTFLTNSSVASYERLKPQHWVGVYQVWGICNKEAPLRLALDRSNMELKTLDAVSNAYLAMAALVAAGLNGLRARTPLPPPCAHDPHTLPPEQRAQRLPTSLEESAALFREAAARGAVRDVMAPEAVSALLSVKAEEVRRVQSLGLAQLLRNMNALH